MGRLAGLREEEKQLKELSNNLNPSGDVQKLALRHQYWSNYGFIHGDDMLKIHRETAEDQRKVVAQKSGKITQQIPESLRLQLEGSRESIQGSSRAANIRQLEIERTRELQALKEAGIGGDDPIGTPNKIKVNQRFDLQIAQQEELAGLDDKRFLRQSSILGVERSLLTDEAKRAKISQLTVDSLRDELATTSYMSQEQRRALQNEVMGQENQLRLAKVNLDVAETRYTLAKRIADIQASGVTDEAKHLAIVQSSVKELQAEYDALKNVGESRARQVEIQLKTKQNELRLAQADYTVSESKFRLVEQTAMLQATNVSNASREHQVARATLKTLHEQLEAVKSISESRARELQTSISEQENLVRLSRQDRMFGKSPLAIEQEMRAERLRKIELDKFDKRQERSAGLLQVHKDINGNVVSGVNPFTGEREAPAPGKGRAESGLTTSGLSTSGLDFPGSLAGRIFEQSSAAEHLSKSKGASERLAGLRGDPKHDPAARLREAKIFPDLKSVSGGMAGLSGLIDAQRSIRSSHSMPEAAVKIAAKQLQTTAITNTLIQNQTAALLAKMNDLVLQ
jgi:hypothetical protein